MIVKFKKLTDKAKIPTKGTPDSGAYDLYATECVTINPGCRKAVATDLAVEIPVGYVALVCPRSGNALTHGITVLNSPGVVDADFRNGIKVIVINQDPCAGFLVNTGDRVAQLLFVKAESVVFEEVAELSDTVRGKGGFGSTGKN